MGWPHIAALKTPGSMMLECATVLAAGCDSLALYWGSDKNAEPRETYDFFFETFAAWKPYLLAVREMSAGTRPSGVFLLNPSMGATRPLKLAIRNGKSSSWRVANERGDVSSAILHEGDGEVVLEFPPLPAASSYLIVPECRSGN